MNPYPLFDCVARRQDPITSHRAADKATESLSANEDYALQAIYRWPGRTAKELEKLARDETGRIHRRIKGLSDKGRVRREYPAGCKEAKLYAIT